MLARAASGEVDAIFVDAQSHFSVMDALRMLAVPQFPFAHRDADALSDALAKHLQPGQRPLAWVFPESFAVA